MNTGTDTELDEIEDGARAEALVHLRQAEALLTSGRASGLVMLAFNADGFVSAWRSLPGTREAYSEAKMMLDEFSGLIRERWIDLACNEVDSLPTLIEVTTEEPE